MLEAMAAACAVPEISEDPRILRRGGLAVAPLVRCPQAEILLADACLRWMKEGTLETIFHEGFLGVKWMIEWFLCPENTTLAAFRGQEFCGLGWFLQPRKFANNIRAECGLGFFRQQSNRTQNLDIGRMMLDWVFEHLAVDVLYGATPEPNKLALRFAKKLGFNVYGPVPYVCGWKGEMAGACFSIMTREDWLAWKHWRERL